MWYRRKQMPKIDTPVDEWKEKLLARLKALEHDRNRIITMDDTLNNRGLLSMQDREIFKTTLAILESEISYIKWELILDDMLASDLALDEFLKKYK